MRLRHSLLLAALLLPPAGALAQTQTDLFDDGAVHEVRMTMKDADWQALKANYLLDTYYTVDSFQWKGAGNLTASVSNIAIHSRGHGSRSPIKPGLHIAFDQNVKGQTFLGLSTLELKANTQDASMIHERITMLLFQRMGVPAPREVSSRFYLNGEYIGLYNLVEFVNSDFLTRVFHENTGYLYQYVPGDWQGIPNAGYHFEYLGSDLARYASNTVATPFNPETHSNAPDTVTLEGMIRTINQEPDATFISAMTPYLDLKAWLTHVAVETYVADFDCILGDVFGMNNFHLYRFVNKQLNKFIAWDKDNAFDYVKRPVLQNAGQNVLMRRLMAIPEYRNAYFDALLKCSMLAGGAGGWMQQEAAREYNQIQAAAYADPNKQFLDSGFLKLATNDQFDAANVYVQGFFAVRTPFVLGDVANQGYQVSSSSYPSLSQGGVVSAGTHSLPVAAGGAAEIYGANFGTPDTTSLYINGYLAPLLFTSGGQVDVQVPWEAAGAATVGVIVNGAPSNILTTPVSTYAPAILAVTHTDGQTYVTSDNPAAANETVIAYATGLGPVTGGMVTGQKASTTTLQSTTQTPTVSIGGGSGTVAFSGLTPGFISLYQINVKVPAGVSGLGTQLVVSIGGQSSPPVSVPTR